MNYIDIIIAIPALWFCYRGFKKGVIIEAASLLALALGIFGALKFSGFTSGLIMEYSEWKSEYLPVVSFAITFIIIVIIVHFVARLADRLAKAVAMGLPVKILGAALGIIKIALILSVLINLLDRFDKTSSFLSTDAKNGSLLYNPVREIVPAVFPLVESIDLENAGIFDETAGNML